MITEQKGMKLWLKFENLVFSLFLVPSLVRNDGL